MTQIKSYTFAPLSSIHKKLFVCIFLGQISCSYALGIAGTAVTQAIGPLNLTSFWVGLLGAGTLIGLFGSVVIGNLADKIGRRLLFNIDMILFTILSLAQFFVSDVTLLFILRIGIGITIAIDYTVGSALLTEWFPAKKSAQYQSFLLIFWIIGFVASYIVGIFLTGFGDDNWRWIISSSVIFGLITALWRLKEKIPESPAWLASVGRKEEATELIHQYIGNDYELLEIEKTK